jgi:F-type H+-transporting ATPase subunit epsilon
MAQLKFDLVSPEALLVSTDVDAVQVPGREGDFGVLPNHSPLVSVLRPGILTIETGSSSETFYVRGGFADVTSAGLTILAEFAIRTDEFGEDERAQELELAEAAKADAGSDAARLTAQSIIDALQSL